MRHREPTQRKSRRSWKRLLLIAAAVLGVGGSLSVYLTYRLMFRKNPEAVREIQAANQRQSELDDLFAAPTPDAAR